MDLLAKNHIPNIVKPVEFETEDLDLDDPDSIYFVYICTKNAELVAKLKRKNSKTVKKEEKFKAKTKKRAPKL